jgi:hypothetical protein
MSFGRQARRVRNSALSVGQRHVALRSCVERFCPIGFRATWSLLERRFGFKQGHRNSPDALVAATNFLSAWREVWLAREAAERELRRWQKHVNIPESGAKKRSL